MNEPLTLKAGCYYRTRDGRKAYVDCIIKPSPWGGREPWPVMGWIEGHGSVVVWDERGKWSGSCSSTNVCDLIAEWREPKSETFVAWLTDEPGIMHIITTPEMSYQPPSGYKVLARKTVMITEGEGLQ